MKNHGLATYLEVGKHSIANCLTKFDMTIELTKKGLEDYRQVVAVVFQYIQNMRNQGLAYQMCNELNQMGLLKYDYPDRTNPVKSCMKLSGKLSKIPEQDISKIIKHSYLKEMLDKDLIESLSNMFCKPERMNIYLQSKSLKDECIIQEDFMMTKFFVEEIPPSLLQAIKEPAKIVSQKNQKLDFPIKNHLLPSSFEIKTVDPKFSGSPNNISIWKDVDVWFKQDEMFQHPKAIVQMKLYTSDLGFG